MKKNLFFVLLAVMLITVLASFTPVKNHGKVVSRMHKKTAVKKKIIFTCTSGVNNLSQTGSFSFAWMGSGTPDHYNYGGYYQAGGTFSGSTTGTSVTIPSNSGTPKGGRFGVTAICSDGSTGGSQNILFN